MTKSTQSSTIQDFIKLSQKPTKYKKIIYKKYGVPVKAIALYLSYSYIHNTQHILNGIAKIVPSTKAKSDKLKAGDK